MSFRAISLLLLAIGLGGSAAIVGTGCAQSRQHRILVSSDGDRYQCPGPYPGSVHDGDDHIVVRIAEIARDGLDLYANHRPLTGGDRLLVYLDVDGDKGAEYVLMIYRDQWTLRRGSRPGMVDVEVAMGEVVDPGPAPRRGARVEFPTSLIEGRIRETWHYRM